MISDNNKDVVVSVKSVSKKFCKHLKRSMLYGITDLSKNLVGISPSTDKLRRDEFWALNDVSFELKRGETLGLIGVNGCGKTTLLRLLTGIFPPDKGEISIRGRVGALIAVGAGFHPHLTGRENIYLNGSILGMTKQEINEKFDEIVDFAGIGEFLEAPVATYSSGMRVRLGFSVATAIKPDLLLLDEILAVGDARFRNKCYNKIGNMYDSTATVFVSHSMTQIAQICNQVLLMDKGKILHFGDVDEGILKYHEFIKPEDNDKVGFENVEYPLDSVEINFSKYSIQYGEKIELSIKLNSLEEMPHSIIRIPIYDLNGVVIAEWNSKRLKYNIDIKKGHNEIAITLGPLYLKSGDYYFGIVLNDSTGVKLPLWSFKYHTLEVTGEIIGSSSYQLPLVSKQ